MDYVYINGEIIPRDQARIAVDDRGFRFGDGVFETIRLFRGVPVFWGLHLERLQAGLAALRIDAPIAALRAGAERLITQCGAPQEGFVRLAISRGCGSLGYLPTHEGPPTVVMELLPARAAPADPVSLWVSNWRRPAGNVLPGHAKLAQGVGPMLARMEAQDHGCFEALVLDAAGNLCEASAANLFWARGGALYTPSLQGGALAGVIRAVLMTHALMPVHEGLWPLETLLEADEVFLTSVSLGCTPVRSVEPAGAQWEAHPLAQVLGEALTRAMEAYVSAHDA